MITKFKIFEKRKIKKKKTISTYSLILRGEYHRLSYLIKSKKLKIIDYDVNISIYSSKLKIFKLLIDNFDFKGDSNNEVIKNSIEKLCSKDKHIKTSSRMIWITYILNNKNFDWFKKDDKNKYFIEYVCDNIKEKIKKMYPEKYNELEKRKNLDKFNI